MTLTALIVVMIATNLASLVIGWLVGRTARNTARALAEVEAVTEETEVPEETKRRLREIIGRVRPMHLAMVLLVAIGAVTALLGFSASTRSNEALNQTKATLQCVRDYADGLADTLKARADSAADAQSQLDQVMETVANAFSTPNEAAGTQVRIAIDGYVKLRRSARAAQQANPYPDPPRDVCSDVG